jgi:hypothetical protein
MIRTYSKPTRDMTKKNKVVGIELGSLVKDSITGFTGIAVARSEFGYGCVHISIQAQGITQDGSAIPVHSFDDQRVETLEPPKKKWPKPKECKLNLGDFVRDTLTGVTGIVTAKTTNLDGRMLISVQHLDLDSNGEPKPLHHAIVERFAVVDRRKLQVSKDSVATSGGPMPGRAPGSASGFAAC